MPHAVIFLASLNLCVTVVGLFQRNQLIVLPVFPPVAIGDNLLLLTLNSPYGHMRQPARITVMSVPAMYISFEMQSEVGPGGKCGERKGRVRKAVLFCMWQLLIQCQLPSLSPHACPPPSSSLGPTTPPWTCSRHCSSVPSWANQATSHTLPRDPRPTCGAHPMLPNHPDRIISSTYMAYSPPSHIKTAAQRWNAQNSLTMNFNALLSPAPTDKRRVPQLPVPGRGHPGHRLGCCATGHDGRGPERLV